MNEADSSVLGRISGLGHLIKPHGRFFHLCSEWRWVVLVVVSKGSIVFNLVGCGVRSTR